jgi:hypothetical protein
MEWQELRDKIYFQDGSLRDIYIQGTTQKDWKLWTEFVSAHYKVSFTIYEGDISTETIDFDKVLEFWNGGLDSSIAATVYVGDIIVKSYFFCEEEIENDITPKEVTSLDDHNNLIDYLKGVSKALNKRVIMTPEMEPENILILVEQDDVTLINEQ